MCAWPCGLFRKFLCAQCMYHFTNYQLSCFFKKSSCAQHTYHFTNYQVWGFPVPLGNFCVCDVRTISSTTKCGLSSFFKKFSCVCVRTISPTTKHGIFQFLQKVFMHMTYIPCSIDNTGAHSGSLQLYLSLVTIKINTKVVYPSWPP